MKMLEKLDARGWIGLATFFLTVMVLWMVAAFPELRGDEFFKVLATAIVIGGFIQGVVGWAFAATKQGGELADRNAALVEHKAKEIQKVQVEQPPGKPVPTTDEEPIPSATEELPEYAR